MVNLFETINSCFRNSISILFKGAHATSQWYDTITNHNFSSNEFNEKSGSFTQVVWKDTQEVGFGVARAPNGFFYSVNYLLNYIFSTLFITLNIFELIS
jgi:hypothetical protein